MISRRINFSFMMVLILSSLFLGACGIDKSGVEIVSQPTAKVYLNSKESGMTPYKNNSLKPGEIEIKLDDGENNFWERKIKLENNVTTVINWNFNKDKNSGYILSMENTGENGSILLNSSPRGAAIYIDGELVNTSPTKIENIVEGDRKVSISYPGYKSLNLIVKIVKNYQLIIDTVLEKEENKDSIVSNVLEPTEQPIRKVRINNTETGWLRVREAANNEATEIGKVKPGEKYELVDESGEWYQIIFGNDKGWISTKYAEKILE